MINKTDFTIVYKLNIHYSSHSRIKRSENSVIIFLLWNMYLFLLSCYLSFLHVYQMGNDVMLKIEMLILIYSAF